MLYSLALLLAAAPARTVVIDRTHVVPAAQWSYIDAPVPKAPAVMHCGYRVVSGGAVRLALVAQRDLDRFRAGAGPIAATGFDTEGRLRHPVREPAALALVVDNSRSPREAARVHLRVEIDPAAAPVELSSGRRTVIVGLSLAMFCLIAAAAAARLRGLLKASGTPKPGAAI